MTRVIILGAGVMGTAFAMPLSDRGMNVHLVGTHLDRELVAGMQATRHHARLRAEIGQKVTVHDDHAIADAFQDPADLVIIGISTPGVGWATEQLARHMHGMPPIVMLTKGIGENPQQVDILPDVVAEGLRKAGTPHGPIGAVGGPCIAGELAVRRDTTAIIAFREPGLAERWAAAITTDYYQLRPTEDLVGVEVCAALKNFYAIGVSVPQGQAEVEPASNAAGKHNATASLFNQAVGELAAIVAASGGRAETAFGLAGLGDLHVTCQAGRNSKLGRLLGGGLTYSQAMSGPLAGETVEGTLVAGSLKAPLAALAASGRLPARSVPLAHAIVEAVTGDGKMRADWTAYHGGAE